MEQKKQFAIDKSYKLSDREKAREKIDMFFGDRSNFMHPLMEALNNGIDEVVNNFESGTLTCILHDDLKTITVIDTGRGIPIYNEEEAETMLRTLFAGGKYDVTDNTTTGTFGCGLTATNYNSSLFECTSYLNGKIYHIKYIDGGYIEEGLTCDGDTNIHGTKLTFKLDVESFDNIIYNPDDIKLALRRFSQVSEKITIIFKHKDESIYYNNTFEEYFDNYATDTLGEILYGTSKKYNRKTEVERKGKKIEVDEILEIQANISACTSEDPLQETMLNGNYLKEHGTIYDGIVDGIKSFTNKYCKDNKLYKTKEKPIVNNDVSAAITFTCRVFNNLPSYGNQTKFYTRKEYYKEVAKEYIQEQLEIYKEENRKDFDRMIQQILICKRANENNEKAKQVLKKKLTEKTDSINNRVDGFVDCEINKGGELFLTEGLSALGSIVLARNAYNQAAYPLRGKLINVLKNPLDKIFKNEEILDIMNLLGTSIEFRCKFTKDLPNFNINNLKWDKIICTADADPDGKQINVLILTALYKLVPSIITGGYVYIAQSPLFEIKVSDEEKYYALSEAERDKKVKELNGKKYEIHRLKGLGEVSKDVMYDTVCNPETRVLQQVTVEDVEKMSEAFNKWMDDDVSDRKEYIENNLYRYLVEPPIEDITNAKNIENIIEDNMMEYSAETIFDRALSSIESGLKPSQAKSLWAMYVNKVTKLTKSLNISGAVTSYHAHGSVYPTIVNMSQEDRHIQPLIIGEGNFGNYTSKLLTAAADRYTNIKLSELALDGLKEVDKKYVDMIPTYDGKKTMPLYIPSKYPVILTQATKGMAVGMASTMPSFNFNEICEAIDKYIITGEKTYLVPDFATYGYIENNQNVIKSLNETGKGSLKLRGKCHIENNSIIITEIPYGTFREDIINKIISLVKDNKLKEITDVKDLTGLKGFKIKIDCRKNTNLDTVIEKLYKLTDIESTYVCNMRVLYKGIPKVKGVWEIIDNWLEFRKECISNGLKYECDKINKELNLLYGIRKISIDIDKCIEIIRFSKDYKNELMQHFDINLLQAEYILKLMLRDINEDFINKKISKINDLELEVKNNINIINSNDKLLEIVLEDVRNISKQYKTNRRTTIVDSFEKERIDILVEDYNLNIVLSEEGYLKKVKLTSLRGASEYKFKDGDSLSSLRQTSNKNDLLVFTNKQNCYKLKIHELPDHKPSVLGLYLPSHLQLEEDETIIDVIPTNYTEELLIAYTNGKVARVPLSSYQTKQNRSKLSNATYTEKIVGMHIYEDIKYILATKEKALIFNSKDIPVKSSRTTQGITTMKHANMGEVITFKRVSDCTLDTQSRYIPSGSGKAGAKIYKNDII